MPKNAKNTKIVCDGRKKTFMKSLNMGLKASENRQCIICLNDMVFFILFCESLITFFVPHITNKLPNIRSSHF